MSLVTAVENWFKAIGGRVSDEEHKLMAEVRAEFASLEARIAKLESKAPPAPVANDDAPTNN